MVWKHFVWIYQWHERDSRAYYFGPKKVRNCPEIFSWILQCLERKETPCVDSIKIQNAPEIFVVNSLVLGEGRESLSWSKKGPKFCCVSFHQCLEREPRAYYGPK